MGVSQNWGYLLGVPHNKDYSILGYTLGSTYFGKLPYSPSYVLKPLGDGIEILRYPVHVSASFLQPPTTGRSDLGNGSGIRSF